MPDAQPLLKISAIGKQFPGVRALHNVDLTLNQGEVLSLVGENGAGKSTMMKILAGVHTPDEGTIELDGRAVQIGSVREAQKHGIALIHQELNLSDNLDIAANIFLGNEPHKYGVLDRKRIHEESGGYLKRVGLDFPTDTLVADLTIGHQQLVEISKALSVDARIIIMDDLEFVPKGVGETVRGNSGFEITGDRHHLHLSSARGGHGIVRSRGSAA